jgi:hypothetical protein
LIWPSSFRDGSKDKVRNRELPIGARRINKN